MYSRGYYTEANEKISLPESYDGVAFSDPSGLTSDATHDSARSVEECSVGAGGLQNPWEDKGESKRSDVPAGSESAGFLSGLRTSPLFGKIFSGGSLFGIEGLRMPKIGSEELLILATAAFLLFSRDGDKECALILLFLLFIN